MRRIFYILLIIISISTISTISLSHSGRTDSSGGHYSSATGEYHYHHGYSAHQHPNGECPYEENTSASSFSFGNNDDELIEQYKQENKELKEKLQQKENEISNLWVIFIFLAIIIIPISYNMGLSKNTNKK